MFPDHSEEHVASLRALVSIFTQMKFFASFNVLRVLSHSPLSETSDGVLQVVQEAS